MTYSLKDEIIIALISALRMTMKDNLKSVCIQVGITMFDIHKGYVEIARLDGSYRSIIDLNTSAPIVPIVEQDDKGQLRLVLGDFTTFIGIEHLEEITYWDTDHGPMSDDRMKILYTI